MSGVFARNRTETKLQFFVNALEIQTELSKYLMSNKKMPKKWRYALGYPLVHKVAELVDNISFANSIYPQANKDNPVEMEVAIKELALRRQYQTFAIANCFQIQNRLLNMINCIETVKIEHMDKFIELIAHEIELLKAWKKSSKIFYKTEN